MLIFILLLILVSLIHINKLMAHTLGVHFLCDLPTVFFNAEVFHPFFNYYPSRLTNCLVFQLSLLYFVRHFPEDLLFFLLLLVKYQMGSIVLFNAPSSQLLITTFQFLKRFCYWLPLEKTMLFGFLDKHTVNARLADQGFNLIVRLAFVFKSEPVLLAKLKWDEAKQRQ